MTAPAAHRIRVRYTEPMLRRAVRTFMRRRVLGGSWLWPGAVALLTGAAASGWHDGPSFLTGVFAAGLLFAALFVVALWRAHFANTVGRFRAMDPPEADFAFDDAGLTATSSLGSSSLPWSSFTEVWEEPGFLMLFLAPNQFMTLPLDGLAPGTLAFLRAKLPVQGRAGAG